MLGLLVAGWVGKEGGKGRGFGLMGFGAAGRLCGVLMGGSGRCVNDFGEEMLSG